MERLPSVSASRGVTTFGQEIQSHVLTIQRQFEDYMHIIDILKSYLVSPPGTVIQLASKKTSDKTKQLEVLPNQTENECPSSETECPSSETEFPSSETEYLSSECEFLASEAEFFTSEAEFLTSETEIPSSETKCSSSEEVDIAFLVSSNAKKNDHPPKTNSHPRKTTGQPSKTIRRHPKTIRRPPKINGKAPNAAGQPSENPEPTWKTKRFAYLCLKPLCRAYPKNLIPAEGALVIFSFTEGIVDMHSVFIDPGEIPYGEKAEVLINCDRSDYPTPNYIKDEAFATERKYYNQVSGQKFLSLLLTMAETHNLYLNNVPLFFTLRGDLPVIDGCMAWILEQAGGKVQQVEILSFEILVMLMSQEIGSTLPEPEKVGVCNTEGGAGKFLYDTKYDFCGPITCKWHRRPAAVGKYDECTCNIALRRVFNALYYLCRLDKKPIRFPSHTPFRD